MRYAIYYTPPADDPLTRLAATWLGRDAFGGTSVADTFGLSAGEHALLTAEPRRYGFHATLKAPFSLAPEKGEAELVDAFAAFCKGRAPFDAGRLALRSLDGFLALVPEVASTPLDALAADAVVAFDSFRAPLDAGQRARRRPETLTARQRDHLDRWGYPYVFEEFRFHMTLTSRLASSDAPRIHGLLDEVFRPFVGAPLRIGSLGLFAEKEAGAPFVIRRFAALGERLPPDI